MESTLGLKKLTNSSAEIFPFLNMEHFWVIYGTVKCGDKDDGYFYCVCDTDLCNDGKEDDESGVEMVVPQFAMMFLLSISVYYFTI